MVMFNKINFRRSITFLFLVFELTFPFQLQAQCNQNVNQCSGSASAAYRLGECPKNANVADWNASYEFSRTAKELRKAGRYSESIKEYTRAINKCPQDPNHLLGRANAYYEQATQAETIDTLKDSSLQHALEDLTKARNMHPHWKIPATCAKVYKTLDRKVEALKSIRDSLYASDPHPTQNERSILLEAEIELKEKLAEQSKSP